MAEPIALTGIHHLTLTVTELKRSEEFYTNLLGFQKLMDVGPTRILMINGNILMALSTAFDPSRAIPSDQFNENRLGLDHLSFAVNSRAELEEAVSLFEDKGVPHGEIKDLGEALGLCVLAFRDPDNIQLELTSPRV